jgi:CubicO group peptidase (beta-lactamase class C family)
VPDASPSRRFSIRAVAGVAALALVGGACQGSTTSGSGSTTSLVDYTRSGPPGDPPQTVTRDDVARAAERFPAMVEDALKQSGVPGLGVGVVFENELMLARGFGLRELGTERYVDPDTVFQLASVSKPVGSTVMASLVGDEIIDWDGLIRAADPGFALSDPAVTAKLTFADLYAHRSGLPEHAGDLLEDLGYTRDQVLERLRYYPLLSFRADYAYTNFGLTEAAVAAAKVAGKPWEDLSAERLYKPLGMASTSSRYADYKAATDRATPHVRDADGNWIVSPEQREPDAQTPAGGVSSTVNDMSRWLRMQIANGSFDGRPLIDPAALATSRTPHMMSSAPRSPTARAGFYGLGYNVGYDDAGHTRFSHSGAFTGGAATAFGILANEKLGVVVLSNGIPTGVPEALIEMFFDLATEGAVTRDWLALYGQAMSSLFPKPEVDYTKPPPGALPAREADAYTGTYTSPIYGPLQITAAPDGTLSLSVGPEPFTTTLRHYDRDTFWFTPKGENALLPSSVVFTVEGAGPAARVRIPWLDGGVDPSMGIGVFTRT